MYASQPFSKLTDVSSAQMAGLMTITTRNATTAWVTMLVKCLPIHRKRPPPECAP
eukprot:CAMPEP_0119310040 /NCGR_PEP_ID=MMETSP1333-20130426/17670_1 /TAXON_ID=418940 /ORGANISM="Scyphosphaera apsteinii, Strain RCC1455" /LENGTH=54 /DNA_ID=CAMNT_0007314157 /DNA_START=263 /DNA_END=423 /DNA_ORIENTATION=+